MLTCTLIVIRTDAGSSDGASRHKSVETKRRPATPRPTRIATILSNGGFSIPWCGAGQRDARSATAGGTASKRELTVDLIQNANPELSVVRCIAWLDVSALTLRRKRLKRARIYEGAHVLLA
jgi:hypothetical protein